MYLPYREMRSMVSSVQKFAPGVKLLVFDLGLKESQVKEVSTRIPIKVVFLEIE